MSDETQVVGLLYRADWTRLCPRADIARIVAREVGKEATNAARRFLRRFDIGQPPE
jgi:hypothetical protein